MIKKVGKWKYIAQRLEKESFSKMAEKARQIEKHLKEIYSETITVDFQKDYKSGVVDKMPLRHVIKANSYCVGCGQAGTILESGKCNACLYGRKYGICDDPHSEFGIFFKEIQELKMELKEEIVPFNVDCWNISEKNLRIITHFHGDHIPCRLPVEVVVPFDVKYLTEKSQYLSDKYSHYFNEQKTEMAIESIGKLKHVYDYIAMLKIEFEKKTAILVGDYDAPEWKKIEEAVKLHQPDYLIIPVYAKFISGQKGRLQKNSKHLSEAQRLLINEIKKIKRDLGKPEVIGLAHSKKAKKLRGIDIFIDYLQRLPSLDDYRDGLIGCESMEICKGCQRVHNGRRSKY
ncbi:hypothetical protein IPdc08_00048 [archaeon]|nr:hypothetical protein IPdc08_00048 [archaeon]